MTIASAQHFRESRHLVLLPKLMPNFPETFIGHNCQPGKKKKKKYNLFTGESTFVARASSKTRCFPILMVLGQSARFQDSARHILIQDLVFPI